jgi:hypothetical protein
MNNSHGIIKHGSLQLLRAGIVDESEVGTAADSLASNKHPLEVKLDRANKMTETED